MNKALGKKPLWQTGTHSCRHSKSDYRYCEECVKQLRTALSELAKEVKRAKVLLHCSNFEHSSCVLQNYKYPCDNCELWKFLDEKAKQARISAGEEATTDE